MSNRKIETENKRNNHSFLSYVNKSLKRFSSKTRIFSLTTLALSLLLVLQACNKDSNVTPKLPDHTKITTLSLDMRQLWAEHMQWTYSTVDAFFNKQEQLNANLNRLLQNQQDIGNAFAPYFGTEQGKQLADLLTTHITDAVPVLTAAQAGDNAALEEALDEWYENAQEIGDFHATINPEHWDQPHLRDMWKTHITQTVTYSVALLQGDFEKAVSDYQEAFEHMVTGMSDLISDGIVSKFPEKF